MITSINQLNDIHRDLPLVSGMEFFRTVILMIAFVGICVMIFIIVFFFLRGVVS